MSDRQVEVTLDADVARFVAGIREASLVTAQLQAQVAGLGRGSHAAASGMGATAAAATRSRSALGQFATAQSAATAAVSAGAAASGASARAATQQRNALGQFTSTQSAATAAVTASTAASTASTRASGQQRNALGQFTGAQSTANAATVASVAATRTATAAQMSHAAAVASVGSALLGAGLGLAAFATVVQVAYARFEKAMSGVAAVAGASASEMQALSAAAIAAGASTQYSATQAANAEAELVRAGVSTADVLGGALTGALSLAAAGQLNLSESATIAAQAMNVFNLNGSEVPRVADALASAANISAADVHGLGESLRMGGLAARDAGMSIEETVGTLALFANNALIGSDAGTSLKTMLMRLAAPSKESSQLMEELGFSVYDAAGNMVSIEEVAGRLQDSLKGLTQEQRQAALAQIFGADAMRAASILYEAGAEGVAKMVAATDDMGAAQRMAAIQTDNLVGDLERLKGALETAFIQSGSGPNEALRDMVQAVTASVNAYNDLPPAVQQSMATITILTAAVLLAGGAFLTLVPKVAATQAALVMLTGSSTAAATALTAMQMAIIPIAAAAALGPLVRYGAASDVAAVSTTELTASLHGLSDSSAKAGAGLRDLMEIGTPLGQQIKSNGDALDQFAVQAKSALDDGWDARLGRWQTMGVGVAEFEEQVKALDQSLADMVNSGDIDGAQEAYSALMASLDPAVVDEAAAYFTEYQAALDASGASADLAGMSLTDLSVVMAEGGESAAAAADQVSRLVDAMAQAGLIALSVRDAERSWAESLDALTASIDANGTQMDINTEAGRSNQAALDAVARSAIALAQAKFDASGATADFTNTIMASRGPLIEAAMRLGMTEQQANEYADSVLAIPTIQTTTFNQPGLAEGIQQARIYREQIINLPDGHTTTIRTVYVNSGPAPQTRPGLVVASAHGNVLDEVTSTSTMLRRFADGSERHVAQIAPAGAMRLWAEPETGGEAYIPLAPDKRARSLAITADVAGRFGYALVPLTVPLSRFAQGGVTTPTPASGGISVHVTADATVPIARKFVEDAARANVRAFRDALAAVGA